MKHLLVISIILLAWIPSFGMEVVCKIGDKYPSAHSSHESSWRNGQIIEIFPNGTMKPGNMFRQFVVIQVNDVHVQGNLNQKKFTSAKDSLGKHPWEAGASLTDDGTQYKRDRFIDYKVLLNNSYITQKVYDDIYDKSKENPLIIINDTLDSLALTEGVDTRLAK